MLSKEKFSDLPMISRLTGLKYELLADPRSLTEIGKPCSSANCRRLVQEWFGIFGIYLPRDLCMSEAAFTQLGEVVWDSAGTTTEVDPYAPAFYGDILFADPVLPNLNSDRFYSFEQRLHLAIYLGETGGEFGDKGKYRLVFHTTNRGRQSGIEPYRIGVSSLWTTGEFSDVYNLRRIRRLPAFEVALSHKIQ